MVLHHNTCYSSMWICFIVYPLSIAMPTLYTVYTLVFCWRFKGSWSARLSIFEISAVGWPDLTAVSITTLELPIFPHRMSLIIQELATIRSSVFGNPSVFNIHTIVSDSRANLTDDHHLVGLCCRTSLIIQELWNNRKSECLNSPDYFRFPFKANRGVSPGWFWLEGDSHHAGT